MGTIDQIAKDIRVQKLVEVDGGARVLLFY